MTFVRAADAVCSILYLIHWNFRYLFVLVECRIAHATFRGFFATSYFYTQHTYSNLRTIDCVGCICAVSHYCTQSILYAALVTFFKRNTLMPDFCRKIVDKFSNPYRNRILLGITSRSRTHTCHMLRLCGHSRPNQGLKRCKSYSAAHWRPRSSLTRGIQQSIYSPQVVFSRLNWFECSRHVS